MGSFFTKSGSKPGGNRGNLKAPKGVQPLAQPAGVRSKPGGKPKIKSAPVSQPVKWAYPAGAVNEKDTKALPILKNPDNERRLIQHILERLRLSDYERQERIQRCMDIDIQMSGFIKLDATDIKRQRDNKRGKPPKPTDHNLALTQSQIDECVAYLMSIFAPEANIFVATARADKQAVAEGLTDEINNEGQLAGYYRQFTKLCKNALKYNFSGITCYWEQHMGMVFESNGAGQISKKAGVVWEGNYLKSVDAYNFFYDTTKHPCDLPRKGEFFAEVVRETPFSIAKMAEDGKLFGISRYQYQASQANVSGNSTIIFYQVPPSVRDNTGNADRGRSNWISILSPEGPAPASQPSIELVYYTTWINPKLFGLSQDDVLQLWRITMANGTYITNAIKLDDTHGMLPVAMACPLEDDLINEQRTYAEQLLPLQAFASFLLNSHQKAVRKSIYGVTVYNPHLFPGLDKDVEDLIGAIIPMRSSSANIDIDKAFRHFTQSPATDGNVDMVSKIVDLMQKILPTNQAQQVADLERATEYQAAATVQSSNRKNLIIARVMNDQCFVFLKFMMMYNIYANIKQISYTDPQSGQTTQISPADLIEAQIELDVGTGLRGLDRLMQISIMKDILGIVIQNQQALAELDIVSLLNYIAGLAGDKTDLAQFKKAAPNVPGQPGMPGSPTEPDPNAQQPPGGQPVQQPASPTQAAAASNVTRTR